MKEHCRGGYAINLRTGEVMGSIRDWEPVTVGNCEINVGAQPEHSAIYFHGKDNEDVGKILMEGDKLTFEGDMGTCVEVLGDILSHQGNTWQKPDGSYHHLTLSPGGIEVTLKVGPYPEIIGPCSSSLWEFMSAVNTLIMRSCDAKI